MTAAQWWGQKHSELKMHWTKWDNLCVSKRNGGLGFRELQSFNLAMLAKQGWKFLNDPNSILARIWKAKYKPQCSFLQAKLGHAPSYTW